NRKLYGGACAGGENESTSSAVVQAPGGQALTPISAARDHEFTMTAIPALKHFIRSGVVLLACLATPVVQAQTQTLPALGETSAAVVSSVEETRLGRQF